MAVPLLPPQIGTLGYPSWGATAGTNSRPELDLSQLWISHPPPQAVDNSAWMTQVSSGVGNASLIARLGYTPLQGGGEQLADVGSAALGKRLVLNHNKAITKKLASAVHYQQVLDCVAESVQYFDEVNVATALHRVAKLQPPSPGGQMSPIVYADQFQQLIAAVRRLLHRFEAQAVSNTMWAFATLCYYPDGNLLEDVANHAVSIMSTFRPQATSNTLWAFAKLAYCPTAAFLRASVEQMLRDLPRSVPQDISNTLWALATLRHHPGDELMRAAAAQAVLTAQHFKPQEIANTLWSFATLGHNPGPQLLDAMAVQMVSRIQLFRPQAVSNSLWAYAKLNYNPGKLLIEVASHKAAGMLHQYTSQELANTLWAMASLDHHPGGQMLDRAAVQIVRRLDHFSPQDMSNCIWAFAKLFHCPCQELLRGVVLFTLKHWPRFKPAELAGIFASLAVLRACSPQTWVVLLTNLATIPSANFDDSSLLQLYQTFLLVDAAGSLSGVPSMRPNFPPQLLDMAERAWKASVQERGRISTTHQEVSNALWKLGVLHHNELVTSDGLFCLDISLDGTQVVVDVQEPEDFALSSQAPLGQTIARRVILESRGFTVLSLPYFEWSMLKTVEQRERYLTTLITSATLAAGHPVASQPLTSAPLPSIASSSALSSAGPSLELPSIFGFQAPE